VCVCVYPPVCLRQLSTSYGWVDGCTVVLLFFKVPYEAKHTVHMTAKRKKHVEGGRRGGALAYFGYVAVLVNVSEVESCLGSH
jgi:hypothetical protein